MLADWEVEVGGDAQVIDAAWPGFVDLRTRPERVSELEECRAWPELVAPLQALNAKGSLVWTTKCDAWTMLNFAAEDRDEYDAGPGDECAVACYVDLLAWPSVKRAEDFCRALKASLAEFAIRGARVEFVVRRARLAEGAEGFGVTVYTAGCGRTHAEARSRLGSALGAWANSVRGDLIADRME